MTDEQLIADVEQQVAESRASGKPPASAEVAVAQLIGIVGKHSPLKTRALNALTKCDWSLALNFLSALTPPGMVFVPAGAFTLGSDESDDEQPPHTVWLDSFYVDKAPVTNKQFGAFWEDVPYAESSDVWTDFESAREFIYTKQLRRAPYYWFDPDWNAPDHPLVGVTWYEAMVFARWAGKRLPSEAEWEKAARGPSTGSDGARRYPWGDTFDASRCNCALADEPLRTTSVVGRYSPQGDSPYCVQDMSGNVWEWTSSLYKPYPYRADDGREAIDAAAERVLRGGSHSSHFEDHFRCAHRHHSIPEFTYVNTGFRCAATIPPNVRI